MPATAFHHRRNSSNASGQRSSITRSRRRSSDSLRHSAFGKVASAAIVANRIREDLSDATTSRQIFNEARYTFNGLRMKCEQVSQDDTEQSRKSHNTGNGDVGDQESTADTDSEAEHRRKTESKNRDITWKQLLKMAFLAVYSAVARVLRARRCVDKVLTRHSDSGRKSLEDDVLRESIQHHVPGSRSGGGRTSFISSLCRPRGRFCSGSDFQSKVDQKRSALARIAALATFPDAPETSKVEPIIRCFGESVDSVTTLLDRLQQLKMNSQQAGQALSDIRENLCNNTVSSLTSIHRTVANLANASQLWNPEDAQLARRCARCVGSLNQHIEVTLAARRRVRGMNAGICSISEEVSAEEDHKHAAERIDANFILECAGLLSECILREHVLTQRAHSSASPQNASITDKKQRFPSMTDSLVESSCAGAGGERREVPSDSSTAAAKENKPSLTQNLQQCGWKRTRTRSNTDPDDADCVVAQLQQQFASVMSEQGLPEFIAQRQLACDRSLDVSAGPVIPFDEMVSALCWRQRALSIGTHGAGGRLESVLADRNARAHIFHGELHGADFGTESCLWADSADLLENESLLLNSRSSFAHAWQPTPPPKRPKTPPRTKAVAFGGHLKHKQWCCEWGIDGVPIPRLPNSARGPHSHLGGESKYRKRTSSSSKTSSRVQTPRCPSVCIPLPGAGRMQCSSRLMDRATPTSMPQSRATRSPVPGGGSRPHSSLGSPLWRSQIVSVPDAFTPPPSARIGSCTNPILGAWRQMNASESRCSTRCESSRA